MKKLISKLDLFPISFVFNFNSETKSSNYFGILYSLAIYGFLIALFLQSDFIKRDNALVLSQTIQTSHAEAIIFDESHILTLGVSDALERLYTDESIFRLEMKLFHLKEDEKGQMGLVSLNLPKLRRCISDDAKLIEDFTVGKGSLSNSYCLDDKNFRLEGGFDEQEIYYAVANLYMCDNITSNGTCKTKEIINQFFNNNKIFFAANFYSASVDLNNYEYPIQSQYINQIQLVDISLTKRLYFYMKQTEVTTDDGWLLTNSNTEKSFKFDSYTSDFNTLQNGQPISQMLFLALRKKEVSHRKYQNLPQILGALNGFAHLIMFFGYIVSNVQNHINSVIKLINSLYYVPVIKKTKKYKSKSNKKKVKIITKKKKNDKNKSDSIKESNKNDKNKGDSIKESNINVNKFDNNLKDESLNIKKSTRIEENNPIEKIEINTNQTKNDLNTENTLDRNKNYLESKPIPTTINEIEMRIKGKPLQIAHKDSFFLDRYSNEEIDMKNQPSMEVKKNTVIGIAQSSIITPNNNSKQSKKKEENPYNLKLGIYEYIKFIFKQKVGFSLTKKQQLIKESERMFTEQLDMIKILRKIQEIEKLKVILLDSDQLALFNSVTKPMIHIEILEEDDYMKNKSSIKMTQLITGHNANKIENKKQIYDKILRNIENNEVNKRLLDLVDREFNI